MEKYEQADAELLEDGKKSAPKIKIYKQRWIILIIFITYSCINATQWIVYSSITHIIVKYYNVSSLAVDWTSIVYMALYPIFVIPASYVIDKKGLRAAGLIGCIGTAVGTGIKVFSIGNDLFFVVLLGQAILSASQVVMACLPPKIASIWFHPNEVSTACALGIFGIQLGNAIGFILPPMIVKDSDNLEEIGKGLHLLCWLLAGSMIPVTLAVIFYFPKQPPLPPSNAQANLREIQGTFEIKTFFYSIKKLFWNKPFVIHMVAYSINLGVFSTIGTFFSQFVLQYFEGANEDSGRMGFLMVVCGMIGTILLGIVLDKTHKYKEMTFFIYLLSAVSIVFLMYSLEWRSLLLTYISWGIIGFTFAYIPAGFELAMELTFPSEEATTTGILLATTQLIAAVFAVGLGHLNKLVGCFWSLACLSLLLFIGTLITGFIPNKLLRQEAFRLANNQ